MYLPSLLSGPALAAVAALLPLASSTSLTISIPPSPALPSPQSLPPQTQALLHAPNVTLTALLDRRNNFIFPAVSPGSYLAEIACRDYAFQPMRIDITLSAEEEAAERNAAAAQNRVLRPGWEQGSVVEVWQTFRGNDWENKGELLAKGTGAAEVEARVTGQRVLYEKRQGFNVLSLLSNPMILIGLAGLGMMIGMPKVLENMDPEMRKEFEETQRNNPLASGANPMGNFDMAAWMAGSGGKESGKSADTKASGADAGGGKARRRG